MLQRLVIASHDFDRDEVISKWLGIQRDCFVVPTKAGPLPVTERIYWLLVLLAEA